MDEVISVINCLNSQVCFVDNIMFPPKYKHVGAIICDAILQQGMNYNRIVYPRVKSLIDKNPFSNTLNDFYLLITRENIGSILNFHSVRKEYSIKSLTKTLFENNINTYEDLFAFLSESSHDNVLLCISGIGPKTVDYLKKIVGIDSMPIDRHVFAFLNSCGINSITYNSARCIFDTVSKQIGVPRHVIDEFIWNHYGRNHIVKA